MCIAVKLCLEHQQQAVIMAHSVCEAGNPDCKGALHYRTGALGAAALGNQGKSCPKEDWLVFWKNLLLHHRALTEELTHSMHVVLMVLYPQLQTELGWVWAILKLRFPFCCDWSSTLCLLQSRPFPPTLLKLLNTRPFLFSWKANLNLKSKISKQWCLKIFIMEFYVVTFSFCCICKVGNSQLVIMDVVLGIWFNN